jgi:sugar lactone lactonase YvrE
MKRVTAKSAIYVALFVLAISAATRANATERYVFENFLDSSQFNIPAQVAIDDSGDFWVADPQNNRIVLFPADRSTPRFFNSLSCPSMVPGCINSTWMLAGPIGAAIAPSGNIWVSDTSNNVVVEVDSSGTVAAFAGVGPSNVVTGCTPPITTCSPPTNAGQGNGQFNSPGKVAVDHWGNIYVADQGNFRVQKFASDGTFLNTWGSYCSLNPDGTQFAGNCTTSAPGATSLGDGQFGFVGGIAVDSVANVYVADPSNNRIELFDSNGTFLAKTGSVGSGNGQFNRPWAVAVDFEDNVYVADYFNFRIQKFAVLDQLQQSSSGSQFTTFFSFLSKGGSVGSHQGQFDGPSSISAYPKNFVQFCEGSNILAGLLPTNLDCRGIVVSEDQNRRVQILSARDDTDNDSITDEADTQPTLFSNNFSNAAIPPGFTTTGSIISRGDQTFVIYAATNPLQDIIRIRTESFGGPNPLTWTQCGSSTISGSIPPFYGGPAGGGADIHCSTGYPTVTAEGGPVGFKFVGIDGTIATAILNTGDSLSVNVTTSQVIDNSGNVTVLVGTKSVSLSPGQTAYVDLTPPTIAVHANITTYATSTAGAVVSYTTPIVTDLLDGTDPVACTPASGSTFAPGTTYVVCSATDSAGNTATTTFSVTVLFSWSGFLQPINPDNSSIFKLGGTVPVKFQLTGASSPITNLVARLYVAMVSSGVTGTDVEAISTSAADSGNTFRYDPVSGQYIFNLGTSALAVGTWRIRADLGDGNTQNDVVLISLKK